MNFRIWAMGLVMVGAIGSAQAQDAPHRGGTLVYGVVGDPDTFDCHRTVSTVTLSAHSAALFDTP